MTTINDLLKQYNDLAALQERPQLNSWKQSKEKLQQRIDLLKGPVKQPIVYKETPVTTSSTTGEPSTTLRLVDILKATGKNPKVVRAKLRKLYAKDATDLPKPLAYWVFCKSDEQRVIELIG